MKIKRNEYAPEEWFLEINDRCFADIINDWRDVLGLLHGTYNWYNFRPICVEFEIDRIAPGYEFTCIVLGLGFRLRYNRDWTDSPIQEALDEALEAEKEGRLLTWEEVFGSDDAQE